MSPSIQRASGGERERKWIATALQSSLKLQGIVSPLLLEEVMGAPGSTCEIPTGTFWFVSIPEWIMYLGCCWVAMVTTCNM